MDDAATYIDRVNGAIAADDLAQAAKLAQEALRAGVKHPLLIRLVAEDMEQRGESKEAIAFLQRGLVLLPGDPTLLVKFGALLAAADRRSEALRMFAEAAKSPAVAAEAHYGVAKTLSGAGDIELALKHFTRALELEPDYDEVRAMFALVLARIGEGKLGRAEAERLLAKGPPTPQVRIALAIADIGDRKFADAEQSMRELLAEPDLGRGDRGTALGVLADALNGLLRIPEAFEAHGLSNEITREIFAEPFAAASEGLSNRVVRMIDTFEREKPERWSGAPLAKGEPEPDVAAHVFLVGFPRSGTTLLEQVLASHGDVITLEEKQTLTKAENELQHDVSQLDRLAALGPDDAARYRRNYWRVVNTFTDPSGKVFIDKMPISSISLPVIAKLFPNAKILFARRDPRDVVLSCFRRAFQVNSMTYIFTTLEGTARFYDRVMALSDLYRRVLPLPVHEVRYERLVADFEGEAVRVCDFLGIEWDEAMRGFAAAAAARTVTTPSAAQVRRGLYKEGQGQWRPYVEHLAPVLPILEPWIGPKGYAVE